MGSNVTFVGKNKDESTKELKKHAATIHCSNTLSLLQRKITNALLYHAYKELRLKDEHEITIKQLCRLIGYQGNNHAAIKDALKGLISTVIEWNLIDEQSGTENWTASSIIASVSLEGPLCYYAYSPRMKQLLHSPSMFGKIDLVIQSKFRSSYGLALYENCIRYRGLPYTKWFEMDLFKKLMGVPIGKYDIFRDFKKRVLDKAIEEVNTYSDLQITAEFIKEGRRVLKIRFGLKERAKKSRLGLKSSLNNDSEQVKGKLLTVLHESFSLSEEQITLLMKNYDSQFILDKIAIIEQSKPFQDGKVANMAGYLFSALKYNYQAKKQSKQKIREKEATDDLELNRLKQIIERIRLSYIEYKEKTIHAIIQSLPIERKSQLMKDFYHFAESTINTILRLQPHIYTKDNVLESPSVKAQLRQFALRELDEMNLYSLEEYVARLDEIKQEAWKKFKSFDPDHILMKLND